MSLVPVCAAPVSVWVVLDGFGKYSCGNVFLLEKPLMPLPDIVRSTVDVVIVEESNLFLTTS